MKTVILHLSLIRLIEKYGNTVHFNRAIETIYCANSLNLQIQSSFAIVDIAVFNEFGNWWVGIFCIS